MAAEIVAPSLTEIFDKIICTSIFPKDWKIARVTSIFKKGKQDDMDNYDKYQLFRSSHTTLTVLIEAADK